TILKNKPIKTIRNNNININWGLPNKVLKKTKAQFAIEFIVLIAFMFLIFLGFIAVITTKIIEAKENERQKIAEDIAVLAKNEIDLAKSVTDGYMRDFQLPSKISGIGYTIKIVGNRELVVNYIEKEYILFLPEKICGDLFIPDNVIDKEKGIVCANSNLDQTQCQNAETLGLCSELDNDFLPGTKCCCCSRYRFCCQ
ncbi:MAG: hypothetical protein Q8R04_00425, partial [Nanoarchaeota archaeon]|nr:hypothetical protein [Nanoarchaeota archaeon]